MEETLRAWMLSDSLDAEEILRLIFSRAGIDLDVARSVEEMLQVVAHAHIDRGDFVVMECTPDLPSDAARCRQVAENVSLPLHIIHPDEGVANALRSVALGPIVWIPPEAIGLVLLEKLRTLKAQYPDTLPAQTEAVLLTWQRTRVFLFGTDPMTVAGLRGLVEQVPAVDIVGEDIDVDSAIAQVRHLRPRGVLIAADVNDEKLRRIVSELHQVERQICMLILCTQVDYDLELALGRQGACSFILWREATVSRLTLTLGAVLQGHLHVGSPEATRVMVQTEQERRAQPDSIMLTHEERSILRGLASGRTEIRLAEQMGYDPRTLRRRIQHLKLRLHLTTLPELIVRARELGLYQGDDGDRGQILS